MPDPNAQPGPAPAATRGEPGVLLLMIGAVLLLISLFMDWYEPGRSAWTVFEVWDLVLAALALTSLVAVAGRLGFAARRPDRWLTVPSVAAFVIVVASLLKHPPAAIGFDPMIGLWVALLASILMLAGVALSVAQVSVAIKLEDRGDAAPPVAGGGVRRGFARSRPVAPAPGDADRVAHAAGEQETATPGEHRPDSVTQATQVIDQSPTKER